VADVVSIVLIALFLVLVVTYARLTACSRGAQGY